MESTINDLKVDNYQCPLKIKGSHEKSVLRSKEIDDGCQIRVYG